MLRPDIACMERVYAVSSTGPIQHFRRPPPAGVKTKNFSEFRSMADVAAVPMSREAGRP
jgi:hypothetical protein